MSEVYMIEFAEQYGLLCETVAEPVPGEQDVQAIQTAIDKLWASMSAKARKTADADERMARYAYAEGLSLAKRIADGGLAGQEADVVARQTEADIQQLVRKYRYEEGTR